MREKKAGNVTLRILGILLAAVLLSVSGVMWMYCIRVLNIVSYDDLQYDHYEETTNYIENVATYLEESRKYAKNRDRVEDKLKGYMEITTLQLASPDMDSILYESSASVYKETFVDELPISYELTNSDNAQEVRGWSYTLYYDAVGRPYEQNYSRIALTQGELEKRYRGIQEFYAMDKEEYCNLFFVYGTYNGDMEAEDEIIVNTGDKIFYSSNFSENTFILTDENDLFVYSPEEDMFFSSCYGWYRVPDVLYFPMLSEGINIFEPFSVLRSEYITPYSLANYLCGGELESYMSSRLEVSNGETNLLYYVDKGDRSYGNIDPEELQETLGENYYKITLEQIDGEKFLNIEYHLLGDVRTYTSDFFIEQKSGEALVEQGLAICSDVGDTIYFTLNIPRGTQQLTPGIYNDVFSQEYLQFALGKKYPFMKILWCSIIFDLVGLGLLVALHIGMVRGQKARDGRISRLYKFPIEVFLLMIVVFVGIFLIGCYEIYVQMWSRARIIVMMGMDALCIAAALWAYLCIVAKGVHKLLWKDSILFYLIQGIRVAGAWLGKVENIYIRRICLLGAYAVTMFISFFVFKNWLVVIILQTVFVLGILAHLLIQARGQKQIWRRITAIVSGNILEKEKKLYGTSVERQILQELDHVEDGVKTALEERIKEERMRSELITNVTHDIKTPLTSIITYVDLIKRENIQHEAVSQYIDVLDQKSKRLKYLMEDLVEMTRITSGNIEFYRQNIDFGELIRQAVGEYEDKFIEKKFDIRLDLLEEPCYIYVDGNRTFRVLENLLQNIYKYAMDETRVYIRLTRNQQKLVLTMKNISREPLNIEVDALMERFVRGDSSRSTEGSGLGLSIAEDLVQLQGGEFHIEVDGDLFKSTVCFPEVIEQQQEEGQE